MSVDEFWMQRALLQATSAAARGEVPVGAVVTLGEHCLAETANAPIGSVDPCAHAEVRALRLAAQRLGNYRLLNATLYVTLEPCMMCLGAMIHARISRLVFAAFDPKTGVVSSCDHLQDAVYLNHKLTWTGGVCEAESAQLLKDFFRKRR